MSNSFSVNVNSQTVKIKVGDNIDEIKKKFGDDANTIFKDIDKNSNGTLDTDEIEALKSNLEKSDFEIDEEEETSEATQAHGNSSARAFNDAVQNMKNRYSSDTLTNYFKGDEDDLHTVKSGDTLYAIAKKALQDEGLSTDYKSINNRIAEIANINNLPDVNNIRIGTKLKVKLTDDGVAKVKENDNNSAKAFGSIAKSGHAGNAQAGEGVKTDYVKKKTLVDGKTSTITVTKNGLNMGAGMPVDIDGNELKDAKGNRNFKDPKYADGGCIMKYTKGDTVMYQTSFKTDTSLASGVALSAITIEDVKTLKKNFLDTCNAVKKAPANETAEAKATRIANNLTALKKLITLTGGNAQVIKNVARFLKNNNYVDKKSDDYKAFVQDLLLTRNADVVGALTKNGDNVDMSVVENDRTAHETLAGMYQEIREKEKAGEKLTDDEIKLKNALVNTMLEDGFKIDADEAKHVNEKNLYFNRDGILSYATTVGGKEYFASDEKLLDEFANKLKAADTDEKKAALFKEYAKTKDVMLARCLLNRTKDLKAKDEDIKTVINANGMLVLGRLGLSSDAGWSDDIKNTMLARIKDIYTKDKGNLENAYWLDVANEWIAELPEDQREAARTEIAETYFEKTTTKDEDGNDKVEYTFNPKRRPTYEEMNKLCYVASDDMKKAMGDYVKLNDMGKGQYNEAIEGTTYDSKNPVIENYSNMVDSMTDKKEVLDFIDNKIATKKNWHIPFDKILEKFPDDKDIKDKLLANIDEHSTISDENRLALAKTYLKEENGKVSLDKSKLPKGTNAVNVLKALPTDCKTGDAEKCFKAVLKELNKGDLETIKQVGNRNPKAVKARLAELVKANMSDKAFIQEVCKLDDSITPYQALYEVDANKAKWDDKTKQVVFEKIFNRRIKIKDKQKYLDGAVKSGLATKIAEDRYIIGSNVYSTSGYNDVNRNDKKDNDDTMSLQRMSKASYENGAKLYGELKGIGSGNTAKMLKGEGNYKNFVTADNVAGLIQGFNDKSPKEGVMQYIANESATIPQATCNVIPNKLMEKAKALGLDDLDQFKDLEKFVKSHSDTTKGYSEDEGKQLDALINALAGQVLFKF